jgi:hypothetical protein
MVPYIGKNKKKSALEFSKTFFSAAYSEKSKKRLYEWSPALRQFT